VTEETENIILEHMRFFRAQLGGMDAKLDLLRADLHDLKVRMTHVEEGLAGVNRRLDRTDERLDRIEKRTGFGEAF
jgi:hypothetical protein